MEQKKEEAMGSSKDLGKEAVTGREESETAQTGRRAIPKGIGRMALLYGVCFAIAFYRNFIGLTFPVLTGITLLICGLFLKKNQIPWKRENGWYLTACLLLGVSTALTTNGIILFFNTAGILLLVTVFMIRQVYDDKEWGLGQYICNILFLYLSMVPEVASPFICGAKYLDKRRKQGANGRHNNAKYIVVGMSVGLPMLLILIEVLSSADPIFSEIVGSAFHNLMRQVVFSPDICLVLLLVILGFFCCYCFLSALSLGNLPEWKEQSAKKNPVVAITFLSMVTAVYLVFCGIQLVFLFPGGGLLPEGYTYASYARQGFFQLLAVCIFNFILVLACLAVFQRNRVLDFLNLVFSGCTYLMIASSAFRMLLYIRTYYLSFLRVLVLWFLATLVFLMAGVIGSIVKRQFPLFRYCMAVVVSCYLVLSFGRVDAVVASYHVDKAKEDVCYGDIVYLTTLSKDAAVALSSYRFGHEKHMEGARTYYNYPSHSSADPRKPYYYGCRRCRLDWYFQDILDTAEDMDLRTFHFSKYWAVQAAKEYYAKQ